MRAIVYREYGSADVLRCEEVERPTPGDDDVLVRVRAASVNAMDRHFMRGEPYLGRLATGLRRPKAIRLGADLAGIVEAVGRNVSLFKPGDEVFGASRGAFAEYVCAHEGQLVPKPASVSFEQAAAVPVAGVTALQGLRDKGRLQPGQRVLITGAAGGVGHFAVQIAKALGAHVTGVCSTRNVDHVLSIGADRVVDYTREDFTQGAESYDLIFSAAGSRRWSDWRRVLAPKGTLVWAGGPVGGWLGPLGDALRILALSPFVHRHLVMFVARLTREDLHVLSEMMVARKLTPVIGKRCSLSRAAEALRYLDEGHAWGKAVVTVSEDDS